MKNLYSLSTRDLDYYLTRLFGEIEQDKMSPLLREFAVLSIGRLAKGKPDFPLSSYITGHPSLIGESLAQPFLSTYSVETLQEIESVLDAMKNTAPNSIPGGLENCLVNVRHRIE